MQMFIFHSGATWLFVEQRLMVNHKENLFQVHSLNVSEKLTWKPDSSPPPAQTMESITRPPHQVTAGIMVHDMQVGLLVLEWLTVYCSVLIIMTTDSFWVQPHPVM